MTANREDKAISANRFIVIGGGAAGFFSAVTAARLHPDREVMILEKSQKLLSKVKVSGGGRCNVTHSCFEVNELVKRYPRGGPFLKKAFHAFGPADTVQWFRERGVELKTEADGRMFPVTDSSQTIMDCLIREANRYKVDISLNAAVQSLSREEGRWKVTLSTGVVIWADSVCIACGGFPKEEQFDWIKATGHTIEAPVPSLFTFNLPQHPIAALMGVSVPAARVKINGTKLESEGPVLITHWGLSGPAILRLSAWGARILAAQQWQFTAQVNWLPEYNENTVREALAARKGEWMAGAVGIRNPFGLPARLWAFLLQQCSINEEKRWSELAGKELNLLAKALCTYEVKVAGKTTFKEEFVTAGGVKLSEVDPHTMQSKLQPSLYFAGEILDVDGITGGFNFQHAWTSGWIAGGGGV